MSLKTGEVPFIPPMPLLRAIKSAARCIPLLGKIGRRSTRRVNVLMLHFGRCGSTAVGNLLRQHKELVWDSEILQYRKENLLPECILTADPRTLIRLRSLRAGNRNFGFELKPLPFMHLSTDQLNMTQCDFFNYIQSLNLTHLIFVSRKHYLRQLLSLTIAVDKGVYERSPEQHSRGSKVIIDCKQNAFNKQPLRDLFRIYDSITEGIRQFASQGTMQFLELEYQRDIMRDPLVAYHQVCDFLEISRQNAVLRNKKVNVTDLRSSIINFDDVTAALEGTEFSWMTSTDEE